MEPNQVIQEDLGKRSVPKPWRSASRRCDARFSPKDSRLKAARQPLDVTAPNACCLLNRIQNLSAGNQGLGALIPGCVPKMGN